MNKQEILFHNLKQIKDQWVNGAVCSLEPDADLIWSNVEDNVRELQKALTTDEEKMAFREVLNDVVKGVIHSVLVMVDGGDALAEKMYIDIVDSDTGLSLKNNKALHEEFFSYLMDVEE